jgi:hypothetical protein
MYCFVGSWSMLSLVVSHFESAIGVCRIGTYIGILHYNPVDYLFCVNSLCDC